VSMGVVKKNNVVINLLFELYIYTHCYSFCCDDSTLKHDV